jgi:hypothetical protein
VNPTLDLTQVFVQKMTIYQMVHYVLVSQLQRLNPMLQQTRIPQPSLLLQQNLMLQQNLKLQWNRLLQQNPLL